jgi:tetratricopeptide (TPR) repeat protein
MQSKDWPTQSAEALASFVEGRDFLRNYIFSGRGDELKRARASFSEAEESDPEFALATYYVAVADSELRDSDAAIQRLESLTRRDVGFLPETYLQLAYAQVRKYEDPLYFAADESLHRAIKHANSRGRGELLPLIDACRAFLYSVMGGRLKTGDRTVYIEKSIEVGKRLLVERAVSGLPAYDRDQVLFQAHNALGIAFMRKGQTETDFSEAQERYWAQADEHYEKALRLRPGAPRVLQNVGTLLRMQGDQLFRADNTEGAVEKWRTALDVYRRSLDVNRHDRFPHYRASELAARLGEWDTAASYYESGLSIKERGGVKADQWERLSRAILARNATELLAPD